MTRNAIRAFQRSVAMRETGDPTVDVFVALQDAIKAETAKPQLRQGASRESGWPVVTACRGRRADARRLADYHRRSGQGDPDPAARPQFFA